MDFLGLSNVFSIVIHVIKLMKKKWMRKIDGKIFVYHLYGAYLQYDVFQNMFWKAICCCNLVNMDFLGLSNVFSIFVYVIKLMKKWAKKIDEKISFYYFYVTDLQYDLFDIQFWKATFCCNLIRIWNFLDL